MLSMVLFLACTDDSLDPFRFSELKKGILLALRGDAFDRLNDNGCSNSFFYNNVLPDDAFQFDVEFLSENQDILQEVRVFALTIPTEKDKAAKPRTQLTVVPASSFTIPSGGVHKQGSISIPFADIKAALNLTDEEVSKLSKTELTIESDIILTDGSTVSSSSIVNSGLYESALFYPAQKLSYCALDVADAKPVAKVSLRKGKPLKAGAKDTLDIVFDSKIITAPTVTLSPNNGTFTTGVTKGKDDKTFYAIYEAPGGFTGAVTATASGATSDDSGVLLTMDDASGLINVDNEVPVEVSLETGGIIGRNQFNTITVMFNEPLATAPEIKVYGQGIDGIGTDAAGAPDPAVHVKMTLDAKDARKASYIFIYKDSDNPTNATHGNLTVDITGGKDGAGNVHADVNGTLLCDVGTPPAPAVALAVGQYDYGTQIRWKITTSDGGSNPGGSTDGTVYYWAVPAGSQAPSQKTATLAGITVNNGFKYPAWAAASTLTTGDIVADGGSYWKLLAGANTTSAPTEGADWTEITVASGQSIVDSPNEVFADFTANGTFDIYFYFVNTSGNVSPNSGALLTGVVMN